MMTDEQKAIEEMAEIIQTKFACREESAFCLNYSQCKGCPHCKEYSESIATALDKAGYRKQSECGMQLEAEYIKKLQAENEELLEYGNQKYEDTINEFLDCLINAAAIPSCAADKFHCWHDREIAETEKRVAKEFKNKIIAEFNKYTKWDDPYCYLYEPEQRDEMFINHLSKIAASFGVED